MQPVNNNNNSIVILMMDSIILTIVTQTLISTHVFTQPLRPLKMAKYNWFKFWISLLVEWLPYPNLIKSYGQLFTKGDEE